MSDQTIENPELLGGCYCGAVRYRITQRPIVKGQCHCRACQHMAGGAPQFFMLIPPNGFDWTLGSPASFQRDDLENAVTRYFCGACGTQLATVRQDTSGVVVKVGTLDAPDQFTPRVAICHAQAQQYHHVPEGIPVFEDLPTG